MNIIIMTKACQYQIHSTLLQYLLDYLYSASAGLYSGTFYRIFLSARYTSLLKHREQIRMSQGLKVSKLLFTTKRHLVLLQYKSTSNYLI